MTGGQRHFAHFVKRRIVPYHPDRWKWLADARPDRKRLWFDLLQARDGGFEAPARHVTRQKGGAVDRVREGDVIWLFSQLRHRGLIFPASLDAMITIGAPPTRDAAGRFTAEAGRGSRWAPLSDWSADIAALRVRLKTGDEKPLRELGRAPGNQLQSLRELVDATALSQRLYRQDRQGGVRFVSYRHKDGLARAAACAHRLVTDEGALVWWDRWSLPRRMAEGREALDDDRLAAFIKAAIRSGDTAEVIGVETDGYDEPGAFTLAERRWAGPAKYRRAPESAQISRSSAKRAFS